MFSGVSRSSSASPSLPASLPVCLSSSIPTKHFPPAPLLLRFIPVRRGSFLALDYLDDARCHRHRESTPCVGKTKKNLREKKSPVEYISSSIMLSCPLSIRARWRSRAKSPNPSAAPVREGEAQVQSGYICRWASRCFKRRVRGVPSSLYLQVYSSVFLCIVLRTVLCVRSIITLPKYFN